ncbi:MAG: hypothetical protein GEU74_16790, partial [Nitriliruptorales bacterium]|nr:hypothetical protein [Nitriliruptorales bacterium]
VGRDAEAIATSARDLRVRGAAAVVGISIPRVGLAAVVTASVLTGVASATIAPLQNILPTMGLLVIIKVFAAVIVGGFGNVTGAIYAGFLLGLVNAMAVGYVSSAYADAIVFAVMISVLLIKPHGLVGRAVRV